MAMGGGGMGYFPSEISKLNLEVKYGWKSQMYTKINNLYNYTTKVSI